MFLSRISIYSCMIMYFIMEGKQTIKTPKKGKYIKFKNFGKKIKSLFMIYEDFENIVVPKDNGKQNLIEFYSNKYEIRVVSNYGSNYYVICSMCSI